MNTLNPDHAMRHSIFSHNLPTGCRRHGISFTPHSIALLLWACSGVIAQSQECQIVFNNRVLETVIAPVYNADPCNPVLAKQGNPPTGMPQGAQTYVSARLSGPGYTAQLFGGPADAETKDLAPMYPTTTFRTADGAGFIVPPATALTVPNVLPGQPAKLQLRVWQNNGGTCTNWLQVQADLTILRGESRPFICQQLGGSFIDPPNLIGLESFSLATPPLTPPPGVRLSVGPHPNAHGYLLSFRGTTGTQYEVQSSTNLIEWTTIGPAAQSSNDWFQFQDAPPSESPQIFYRIKPQ
jgi:hypothetical protein